MAKPSFLVGLAVGYVLGARAGQKRYEQIKRHAGTVWSSGPVQQRVGTVKQTVKAQAPVVAAKLGDAAKQAAAAAGQHQPQHHAAYNPTANGTGAQTRPR